jgi:hypothetical protein
LVAAVGKLPVGNAGTELVLLFFEEDPELCLSAMRLRPISFVGLDGGEVGGVGGVGEAAAVVVFVFGVVIGVGFCVGVFLFTIYGGGGSALSTRLLSASASAAKAKAKATLAHGGLPAEWMRWRLLRRASCAEN